MTGDDAHDIALLKDPNYNIQLTTKYVADAQGACGSGDMKCMAAYHNGGPAAILPSKDCDPPARRYECLYDNREHTIRNTGYDVTRDYVQKQAAVYSSIKSKK